MRNRSKYKFPFTISPTLSSKFSTKYISKSSLVYILVYYFSSVRSFHKICILSFRIYYQLDSRFFFCNIFCYLNFMLDFMPGVHANGCPVIPMKYLIYHGPATLYCGGGKLNTHTNQIAFWRTLIPSPMITLSGENSIMSACNLSFNYQTTKMIINFFLCNVKNYQF